MATIIAILGGFDEVTSNGHDRFHLVQSVTFFKKVVSQTFCSDQNRPSPDILCCEASEKPESGVPICEAP